MSLFDTNKGSNLFDYIPKDTNNNLFSNFQAPKTANSTPAVLPQKPAQSMTFKVGAGLSNPNADIANSAIKKSASVPTTDNRLGALMLPGGKDVKQKEGYNPISNSTPSGIEEKPNNDLFKYNEDKTRPEPKALTDQDKKVVATVIAEAIGEGNEGMQAVFNVMSNRVKKNGSTLFDEVAKPAQFSAFSKYNPTFVRIRDYLRGKPVKISAKEKEAVDTITNMLQNGAEDVTGGATSYLNPKTATDKSWMNVLQPTKQIGKHNFYK